MKRILLLLTLITQFAFSQTNTTTTTAGKYKMNVPDLGAKKDSVVVWDGTTKLLKFRPVSQITGTTNLDQLVSPTGISVFSSTGTDIVLPLATSTNAGLLAPAEKTKLAGIAAGATANQTDAYLLSRANHTGMQAIATVTGLQTALDGKENLSSKGIASGYAGLDASGKVPLTQINDALLGAVNYQGTYNAATNSPALPAVATSNKGFYYVVSAAGTQAGLTLNAGDWIISNGTDWGKIDNNNAVTAVNGATGNVNLTTSNIAEGSNLYYTDARVNANASVAASATARHNALTLGTANGLSLSTQQLSLGLASSTTTGALSSTDWNNFNNKQPAGSYETAFSKNTAFNKNFGTAAGEVAQGNDSRINNGQTAFGWGNHSGLYPSLTGTGASGTWGISISGTAQVANSANAWGGLLADFSGYSATPYAYPVYDSSLGKFRLSDASAMKWYLGLGSNAYSSTAFLPLTGGTLSGSLTVNGTISASPATAANQVVVKSQLDAVAGSSGTFVPTMAAISNISTISPSNGTTKWIKIGNMVTVSGCASYTCTANVQCSFSTTLPFSRTNAGDEQKGSGTFRDVGAVYGSVYVRGSGTDATKFVIEFRSLTNTTGFISYTYTYLTTE